MTQELENPEKTIAEMKITIKELESKLEVANGKIDPEIANMLEIVRLAYRAMRGQGSDDDIFNGLINVKDPRERTRLEERNIIRHSAMRIAAKIWPKDCAIFGEIASMEDPYYVSLEGQQFKEAILLKRANAMQESSNLNINLPRTDGEPYQPEIQPNIPRKKHWWSRR